MKQEANCRLIPEEDPEDVAEAIVAFVEKAKEETFVDAEVEFITKHNGWGSDPENKFMKAFHTAVQDTVDAEIQVAADLGGNDGHYFTSHGIPTACYGTIADDNNFHGIDEFMRIEDFEKVKKVLIHFAEECD
ncbi:MAG: M20/M25/M40 family metallo-hydrolase [Candidatus Thorarchaeota archaeon]